MLGFIFKFLCLSAMDILDQWNRWCNRLLVVSLSPM